jgi:peptidoglycan-associated lipoprotein
MRPHSIVLFGIAAVFLLATACKSTTPPATAPAAKPAAASTATEPAKTETPAAAAETPAAPLVAAVEQKKEEAVTTIKIADEKGKAMIVSFQTVYFDFDKYNIKPEFVSVIKQNADILKKAAALKIVIEGHCDERGTNEYNLALGQRRATAVMKALEAEGVNKDQLKTISYGEERPVDPGHTEEAWAKNRRSVITNGTGR